MAIAVAGFGLAFAALKWWRMSVATVGIAVTWLWIASTPVFADWALGMLEKQYLPVPIDAVVSADVGIVLGGALGLPFPPRYTPDLKEGTDRIWFASRLYRAGKVKRILVTGGNQPWHAAMPAEAEFIRAMLVEWGVPNTAIQITTQSRNTYKNAKEIREVWEKTPFRSALLITSAAHMPRAMAVFSSAGLPVEAAPTDFRVVADGDTTLLRWLPQASALDKSTDAIKEWLGYTVYKRLGYL